MFIISLSLKKSIIFNIGKIMLLLKIKILYTKLELMLQYLKYKTKISEGER